MNFTTVFFRLSDKLLLSFLKRSRPYLKQLNIQGAYRLTAAGMSNICQCHNIQDLNLSDCKLLLDENINIITNECRILLYLNLSFNKNLTDATGRYLAKYVKGSSV